MARAAARPVSNAEYLRRYEREVRRYAARFSPETGIKGPGESDLDAGRWAWIDADTAAQVRWRRYAREHGSLVAMNPDGSWRAWEPDAVR